MNCSDLRTFGFLWRRVDELHRTGVFPQRHTFVHSAHLSLRHRIRYDDGVEKLADRSGAAAVAGAVVIRRQRWRRKLWLWLRWRAVATVATDKSAELFHDKPFTFYTSSAAADVYPIETCSFATSFYGKRNGVVFIFFYGNRFSYALRETNAPV